MNTATLSPPASAAALQPHRAPARGLGVLLIADGLLALAPVIVLGAAIGWPASLDRPPAEQLAAIAAAPDAVALGYGLYLLYSVLVAPVMIGLAARVFGGLQGPLALTVATFAALSALARSIGILRWLTVMPELAAAHAAADPAARAQIEWIFRATTSYGGGIGELLGVSLFMALSLGTLSVAGWRHGGLPGWLAGSGAIVALMLAALFLPALRLPVELPVALVVTALTAWMVAAGVWCLRGAGARS